jgi:hypothetical protein
LTFASITRFTGTSTFILLSAVAATG